MRTVKRPFLWPGAGKAVQARWHRATFAIKACYRAHVGIFPLFMARGREAQRGEAVKGAGAQIAQPFGFVVALGEEIHVLRHIAVARGFEFGKRFHRAPAPSASSLSQS